MKELQTRSAPKFGVLETEDAYHIHYVEETTSTATYGIRIPWSALFALAAVCLLAALIWFSTVGSSAASMSAYPDISSAEASDMPAVEASADTVGNGLLTSGFVFPDSAERLLTEDDITSITSSGTYTVKELLRFAVNEIYARNGYEFSTAFYREFYRQFGWYTGGLSAEQAVLAFNHYERKNVDFLLSVEAQYSP